MVITNISKKDNKKTMKKRYSFTCPCQDKKISIAWFTEDEYEEVEFCPFCSVRISDEGIELKRYDYEEED